MAGKNRQTTILMAGGGTAGHITPLIAVARELRHLQNDLHLVYVGEKGAKFKNLIKDSHLFDKRYFISAGKLRRYPSDNWLKKLTDVPTLTHNSRDLFKIARGYQQSRKLIRREKPALVFVKGGFVSVPLGVAAGRAKIPIISHDSDASPGLANRLINRWVGLHLSGFPVKESTNSIYTGIPLRPEFKTVTPAAAKKFKQELGLGHYSQVLFVGGASQGAQSINNHMVALAPQLLKRFPMLAIVHLAGISHEYAIKHAYKQALPRGQREQVIVKSFLSDLYRYSAAADLIVWRASATNMAEFALQGKACIVIPGNLAGDHQTKNAKAYEVGGAVKVVAEQSLKHSPAPLLNVISALLNDQTLRETMADKAVKLAKPEAAKDIAKILLEKANQQIKK